MWPGQYVLILTVLLIPICKCNDACYMENVSQDTWSLFPVAATVIDTQRGVFLRRATENILGIQSIQYGEGLNAGPYINAALDNSEFTLFTNNNFENYEEYEVTVTMSVTVTFRCASGATNTLVFLITVIDTNNNAPSFRVTDSLEFTIPTPVGPGYVITGCLNDIIVRDIDLTTQRIEFGIENNPYFEIVYNGRHTTDPKQFNAVLRTSTLVTNIPEPIELSISATDVDLTGDPPITTYTTIRIQGTDFELPEEPIFSQTFYLATYTADNDIILQQPITLQQGSHEDVEFSLERDYQNNFRLVRDGNEFSLEVITPLSSDSLRLGQIYLVVRAEREHTSGATSTIIIQLPEDDSFDKVLYEGIIQAGTVQHETITLSGFEDVNVEILGDYAELFFTSISNGTVIVRELDPVTLSHLTSHITLELRAFNAGAVLLLNILDSENTTLPTVTFSAMSYILRAEVSQTGLVGRVLATADNGESVSYALQVENAHLQQRISVDNDGGIHLSAPANSGVYSFHVHATTVFTQVTGTAPIHLTIDAITICGEDDLVVPPLIILDRDEEEPHRDLVVINGTQFEGCRYSLANRWPIDQTWLYVDEYGLHTTSVDREHDSIAFMALSQVQVELILECDRDNEMTRTKRSLNTGERLDWLGPYDYGSKNWIITDSILYNSRRTLVNLIVNDINDNYPIFVGKENEPITVGYPVPELEERVLPRVLIELKATDADVGENAALVYSSSHDVLAVSPTSGLVHVRNNAYLEDGSYLTVYATDRNGEGLTGSLQLLVKLLHLGNIAVVTVQNALLDDEETILKDLSTAVGYEIKALSSAVVTDTSEPESNEENARKKRDLSNTNGAALQLYIYGIIDQEPVETDRLTDDINNNVIATLNIVSTQSLEDHLEALEICNTGRDTGLFAATIVLSVLLFILIVTIAVWFFLKWRKNKNYEQFTDNNSLTSENGSIDAISKPMSKPRLNIEELRRSERRLQEMLEAPVEEIAPQPSSTNWNPPTESIINISTPDPQVPIVIQSIDKLKDSVDEEEDEDEFGEIKATRRKSVVTFNENVEKIIHVEDPIEDDYEIYKL